MPKDKMDVEAALLRKGFQKRENDHSYFRFYTAEGKRTDVFTKTSHSHREISDILLGQMAKQCKLTKKDFFRLVDCTLSYSEYEEFLLANHLIRK